MRLKVDFHIHSKHSSDGFAEIEDLILAAKGKGLDAIAITDHDTLEGHKEAMSLAKKHDFLVIPGCEIKSKSGDILALNITEKIPKKLSAKETVDLIHKQGGIAIAAHPYSIVLHPFCVRGLTKKLDFDAIEVFNARTYFSNSIARKAALKLKRPMTAGSDTHLLKELGGAYTIVDAKEKSAQAILEAICKGKTEPVGRVISPLVAIEWYARRIGNKLIKF